MKRLWLVLLAVVVAIAAESAVAAVPAGDLAAAPNTSGTAFGFRQVDWHDHHHHHHWRDRGDDDDGSDFYLGFGNYWAPGWSPYWMPGSYYYSPPIYITAAPPQRSVYISHDQDNQRFYWYYCQASHRYYPYVKHCPGGWMKVVPHPPKN